MFRYTRSEAALFAAIIALILVLNPPSWLIIVGFVALAAAVWADLREWGYV